MFADTPTALARVDAGKLRKTSSELALSTPEGLARFQAAESRKWGRIIGAAGIAPE